MMGDIDKANEISYAASTICNDAVKSVIGFSNQVYDTEAFSVRCAKLMLSTPTINSPAVEKMIIRAETLQNELYDILTCYNAHGELIIQDNGYKEDFLCVRVYGDSGSTTIGSILCGDPEQPRLESVYSEPKDVVVDAVCRVISGNSDALYQHYKDEPYNIKTEMLRLDLSLSIAALVSAILMRFHDGVGEIETVFDEGVHRITREKW